MKTRTWLTLLILLALPFICRAEDEVYTLNEQWVECGNGVQLLDPYYITGVTIKWDGPSKNGKAHGKGTATRYIDGEKTSTYIGEYKNGVREGKGSVELPDGSVQKGTFVDGQLIGKGTMTMENGDVYEGEFVNYQMHGNGKLKMGSGATFEGFFVDNDPYTGKLTSYDGTVYYIQDGELTDRIVEAKSNYKPKTGTKVTEYFNENWERTDAKNAKYYRIITYKKPNLPQGTVKDFYMNGQLQGEADFVYVNYDDERKNFKEGQMTLYHPNGKVESVTMYFNNILNGPQFFFDEAGNRQQLMVFDMGELLADATYFPSGSIKSLKQFEDGKLKDNIYYTYNEDGTQGAIVLVEDFEENRKHWEYQGPNGVIEPLAENVLYFNVTPYRSLSQSTLSPFISGTDGALSLVTVRKEPSEDLTLGILLGFKDWDNYSGFYLRGNQYSYMEILNGKTLADSSWKYSSAIDEEINAINISNTDGILTIEINDEILGSIESPEFPGDFVVVTASNKGDEEMEFAVGDLAMMVVVPSEIDSEDLMPGTDDNTIITGEWKGNGSGFFIDENGLIATNYHVVEGAKYIEVTLTLDDKKESYPATVVLSDEDNDLSVIKITSPEFKSLPPIPYNFTTKIMDTGTEVFAMGYPYLNVMGEEVKFTDGKISSKTGYKGDKRTYQISAPVQPGNSGGPLFDTNGNLIGINSAILRQAQNVTYAIKTKYLKDLVDRLPGNIKLQDKADCTGLTLVEMVKKFTPYVPLIKVK